MVVNLLIIIIAALALFVLSLAYHDWFRTWLLLQIINGVLLTLNLAPKWFMKKAVLAWIVVVRKYIKIFGGEENGH